VLAHDFGEPRSEIVFKKEGRLVNHSGALRDPTAAKRPASSASLVLAVHCRLTMQPPSYQAKTASANDANQPLLGRAGPSNAIFDQPDQDLPEDFKVVSLRSRLVPLLIDL
jgi:hypothetical protein